MKSILTILKKTVLSLMVLLTAATVTHAQETIKEASVKALVESGNYVFKAQSALPMGMPVVQLTSDFDVTVSKDTIAAFLPYYGRAYTAPVNPAEGGIRFTSTAFEYKAEQKKKGGWNITVNPTDITGVQLLTLRISKNGFATLQVTSNNRQPISFNGYISERGGRKNK